MTDQARRAYDDWRSADTAAREAEHRLAGAWIALDMGGEPPSKELLAEVSRLRALASDRLQAAVLALDGKVATVVRETKK